MGIGIDIKGAGEILKGAGTFAKDVRSAITGELSPEKKAELELRAKELEARALEIDAASMQAQVEVNKIEAASTNWRGIPYNTTTKQSDAATKNKTRPNPAYSLSSVCGLGRRWPGPWQSWDSSRSRYA